MASPKLFLIAALHSRLRKKGCSEDCVISKNAHQRFQILGLNHGEGASNERAISGRLITGAMVVFPPCLFGGALRSAFYALCSTHGSRPNRVG